MDSTEASGEKRGEEVDGKRRDEPDEMKKKS